jgi:dGTPase
MEVSHIGQFIVSSIIERLGPANTDNTRHISSHDIQFWITEGLSISNIVEIACLIHDIGNPPFGHFGENAISQWFKDNAPNILKKQFSCDCGFTEEKVNINDFYNFDGNPQGLRIITRLQGLDGLFGLNLTYTQLSAFLKYTYSSSEYLKFTNLPFTKKSGFFSTEEQIMKNAWNELNMPMHSRHPLGFLMEASDDISYCLSDIEDGIEKGLIVQDDFFVHVKTELLELQRKETAHDNQTTIIDQLITKVLGPYDVVLEKDETICKFVKFKTTLSNALVKFVAEEFIKDYNNFTNFERKNEIISNETEAYKILKILKNFTFNTLFTSKETESIELSGHAAITGLLNYLAQLLTISRSEFSLLMNKKSKLGMQRRLFNLLPESHIKAYYVSEKTCSNDYDEWNLRAHLIVDFISGMTDHFAMETYQLLKGIKVG